MSDLDKFRQDAIDVIRSLWDNAPSAQHVSAMFDCEDAIRALPFKESERKNGKWIATYSDCGGDVWVSWNCSNCDYVRKKGWKYTDDGKKPDALFCEICGTDMRVEEGGENE